MHRYRNAQLRANREAMSWQERVRQEWVTAQDEATREYLFGLYQEQIEYEREELLESLQDGR
jgi:hypothetical protein